jgi:putative transposase
MKVESAFVAVLLGQSIAFPLNLAIIALLGSNLTGEDMPRRGHPPEQSLNKLRQVEVSVANGKTVALSVREIGVTEQTYYRWRTEYRGPSLDQTKKLKRLEKENPRLKRAVARLTLDKLILKEEAEGNF